MKGIEASINLIQINNMKHAIGFDGKKVKRRKYVAYRNYYTTPNDNSSWDELVKWGFAEKRKFPNGIGDNPQVYHVTRQGMDLLERILECKIAEDE